MCDAKVQSFRFVLWYLVGGFSLAAQWTWGKDHEIVSFVEKDEFCQKVLKKHWPEVPITSDIKDFTYDGKKRIDLLTGGFPCQPFSVAGKRKGKEDDRYLWPEMLRVIREGRPNWIVGENVAGFINLGLETSVADLETEGYQVEVFILPACGVDARHKRDRVWIIANSECVGRDEGAVFKMGHKEQKPEGSESEHVCEVFPGTKDVVNSYGKGLQGYGELRKINKEKREAFGKCINGSNEGRAAEWPVEPGICRVANGIPNRVDRLKSLGNAIVPQVAYQIMLAIKHIEELLCSR